LKGTTCIYTHGLRPPFNQQKTPSVLQRAAVSAVYAKRGARGPSEKA